MRQDGITRCVVDGTSPDDWAEVSRLATEFQDLVIPSFGLHPWKTPWRDDSWKEELLRYLDMHSNACIGECGLDKWIRNPDLRAQEDSFIYQLNLATERNLPISIHILKAWGWLLEILKNHPTPARGFLLHSFGGSKEVAHQLLDMGAYFSFSGYFLIERKQNVRDTFSSLPLDKILLETDAPDMLPPEDLIRYPMSENANHPANLPEIASGLSHHLQLNTADLLLSTNCNFRRFFGVE